jgi:hypothetical protein
MAGKNLLLYIESNSTPKPSKASDRKHIMPQFLGLVALVVRDYDEAIALHVEKLRFKLIEDTYQPAQHKRWVVVSPAGAKESGILLARASNEHQANRVGDPDRWQSIPIPIHRRLLALLQRLQGQGSQIRARAKDRSLWYRRGVRGPSRKSVGPRANRRFSDYGVMPDNAFKSST